MWDHKLDFDNKVESQTLSVDTKEYVKEGTGSKDWIFRDGWGREVYLRGWNVSGSVKLKETNFKPFQTLEDAQLGFRSLRERTGSNIVRFTIAWEGIHPGPDEIDYQYLDAILAQMKIAIKHRIYILLDYHTDLFSRHLFHKDSWYQGNGAPAWVLPKSDYPVEHCGPGYIHWGNNKIKNEAIRRALRNFWLNTSFIHSGKEYFLQDQFLWQLEKAMSYIKEELSEEEFRYIVGVDPINEPFDGGMDKLGEALGDNSFSYSDFDNDLLWPFYKRSRRALNKANWNDKWVFAEPMVFWNTTLRVVLNPTGGRFLRDKPGTGYVFNSHFYDAARMGAPNCDIVDSGEYFKNLDQIREEARFMNTPCFLSEFGMFLGKGEHENADSIDPNEKGEVKKATGVQDTIKIIKGTYQAMELSQTSHAEGTRADFYAPLVPGTQWHWDIYFNDHYEWMNENREKLPLQRYDAWNREIFSAVYRDSGDFIDYNFDENTIQRAYPRRVQGDIMHFHYNDLAEDNGRKKLLWASIDMGGERRFQQQLFLLLTWRGRSSEKPTEVYLPPQMRPEGLLVITDNNWKIGMAAESEPSHTKNEILLVPDDTSFANGGHRLFIWNDETTEERQFHFVLVVMDAEDSDEKDVIALQESLRTDIQEENNPILIEK